MEQKYLFLDYETFSLLDLPIVGLDRYAKSSDTGISMLGWALGNEEPEIWLPHTGPIPKKLLDALKDPSTTKIAWNSQFEYSITKHILAKRFDAPAVPLEQWRDPIILSHNISLPGKLSDVGAILKMAEQKDSRGDELKDMFCQPVNMGGVMTLFGMTEPLFRDHVSHPREFQEYISYCLQDVRSERDIWYRLLKIPFPERDWRGWLLDQKINEFGMPGNRELAQKALRIAERYIGEQRALLKEKTGLENPNSDDQMKEWLSTRGYPWNSVRKEYVAAELDNPNSTITAEAREALVIRKEARKSSYTKLERFLDILSDDDRARNQFRYMGAPRTGRWSSGGGEDGGEIQVQNMSRGEKGVKTALARALELLNTEDYEGIIREFTNSADPKKSISPVALVITILRSLFQAKPGKKIVVADLSAIEFRVAGWMSGCDAITDIFRHTAEKGGDPYLAFGTHLYNKTYAEMWADHCAGNIEQRQNSKSGPLGGIYGLGGGELYENENGDTVRGGLWGYAKNVCGVDMPQQLAHKAVAVFRNTYPEVVQMWKDFEEGFKNTLRTGETINLSDVVWDGKQNRWAPWNSKIQMWSSTQNGLVPFQAKIKRPPIIFSRLELDGGGYIIRMELPSGRALHYVNATIEEETKTSKKGRPYTVQTIYYDGIEHSATFDASGGRAKKKMKWGRVKTYGGKLFENGDQGISRDAFLNGAVEADNLGFHIWGLFHDELACEEDDIPFGLTVRDLEDCMSVSPEWANGLILAAEGFEDKIYKKN